MITLTTTIQEITIQAYSYGVFNYLYEKRNACRDEIFNLFEEWGKEFEDTFKDYEWEGDYYDKIDDFIDFKFTDIKLEDMFPAGIALGDYLTYEGRLFKITGFCHSGINVDEVKSCKENERQAISEISFDNVSKVKLVEYEEIISTYGDSHDRELVRKVNDAWNKNREQFAIILCALYARDIDEITDHDSFQYRKWLESREYNDGVRSGDWEAYKKMALKDMQDEWDFYASNYLDHIADDGDLECIINFLHYPYLPCYK